MKTPVQQLAEDLKERGIEIPEFELVKALGTEKARLTIAYYAGTQSKNNYWVDSAKAEKEAFEYYDKTFNND